MKREYLLLLAALLCMHMAHAQTNVDSLPFQRRAVQRLKPYNVLIPDTAFSQYGLIPLHKVGETWYWEIPRDILGRDLLLVTRVTKGAAPVKNTLPGDELTNMVVRFEQVPGNRLLLRKLYFTTHQNDSSSAMYSAVMRSAAMPILASFSIEAISPDQGLVINPTEYVLGDNEGFSFSIVTKAFVGLTKLFADKSYVTTMQSFKGNLEVGTTKTFLQAINNSKLPTGQIITNTGNASFELNTSLILLPTTPMRQRLEEQRVGYFSLSQLDFDANPDGLRTRAYVKRWRLEPRPEDRERYLRGEMVEPANPIVFYIDPVTPKQWVPYLMQGVADWQVAFEAAGFKNAITAKLAPAKTEDPTWSLYDARHSAIVYKATDIENASGPSIADPRSGEILESHINWYHNVVQLVHDWYLVQCGAVDPRARLVVFPDTLMGQLIRFVIAHEVGHTLGLQHNMAASSTIPVEKLRNKAWVEAHGFCPSIMDYARFNYVAQPQDSIKPKGLFPRIGAYDKWAIQWGYRWLPDTMSTDHVAAVLRHWTTQQLQNPLLRYGPELSFYDPRIQSEDLGDNAIAASGYGIKNLQRILPQIRSWVAFTPASYAETTRLYQAVRDQLTRYLMHVAQTIGGTYEVLREGVGGLPVYQPVPEVVQKKAIGFLKQQLFTTPLWVIDTAILSRTGETAIGVLDEIQTKVLRTILYPPIRMLNLSARNEPLDDTNGYTLSRLLNDLRNAIWSEVYTHKATDGYRRNLQELYIQIIGRTYKDASMYKVILSLDRSKGYPAAVPGFEVALKIKAHLQKLQTDMRKSLPFLKDEDTKDHFTYLIDAIEETIHPSRT